MSDDQAVVSRLVAEFEALKADPDGQRDLTFSAGLFEAYTVVAALQGASRHPGLSDVQRQIVVGFAYQIATALIALTRPRFGVDSAIEATIAMGFDVAYDRVSGDPDVLADDLDEDEPPDSFILGERRCRYVEPSFLVADSREAEMELSKCARCGRFFVMAAPFRLFAGEGDDVLGMEICEACSPFVLAPIVEDR